MTKTTVYLDGELVTRERSRPPIPGVGEFDSGESTVSERSEEIRREVSMEGK